MEFLASDSNAWEGEVSTEMGVELAEIREATQLTSTLLLIILLIILVKTAYNFIKNLF